MPRTGTRTPTIEARILAALRIAARQGLGGLTVAELRAAGSVLTAVAVDRRGMRATGRPW